MKRPTRFLTPHIIACATACGAFASPVFGQASTWNNPSGGVFHVAENWTDNVAPSADRPVEFNIEGTYTVQLEQSETVGQFFNRGGDVTFNLGGNTLSILNTLDAASFNLDGAFSGGQSIFTGGGTIENAGKVTIDGLGSEFSRDLILEGGVVLNNGGEINIGPSGAGANSLTVREGASINHAGTSSVVISRGTSGNTLTITGPGSKLSYGGHTYIGYTGTGTGNSAYVENGGWLETNGILVGRQTQSETRFIIDGADSRVDAAFMQVGGNTSTGNVVEQRDGLFKLYRERGTNPNTYLYVATAGNQVRLMGGTTSVERLPDQIGYVRSVEGSAITVEGGNLITDNLRINNGTDTAIQFLHGSITALNASYSAASAPIVVGDGGSATATYRVNGGTHTFGATSGLVIETNGELRGSGTIEGAGSVTIRGTFQPDELVTLSGNVVFDDGNYVADLENAAGVANFSGTVDVSGGELTLIASETFAPGLGTQYTIANFPAGSAGAFANAAEGKVLSAGQAFLEVSYEPTGELRLTVVEEPVLEGETFAAWAERHNLGANPDLVDDPAGDGIANAVKYALGLDPNQPAILPAAVFVESDGEEYLTLTVARDPEAIEASIGAEVSPDLVTWSEDVVVSETAESIVFRDSVPVSSNDRRFLRLSVSVGGTE